ncbi:MAG: tetratricopeptide repeat protein [Thermoproteota archaeon]|nr:tetratricopeptide repeat protein [Thermoproteota archaeon]
MQFFENNALSVSFWAICLGSLFLIGIAQPGELFSIESKSEASSTDLDNGTSILDKSNTSVPDNASVNSPTKYPLDEVIQKIYLSYKTGNFSEGFKHFPYLEQQLEINPSAIEELYNLSKSVAGLGNETHEKAIQYYDRVLASEPSNKYALNNKGASLSILGREAEAILYYDRVLTIEPNNEYALFNKALSLSILGRDAEAIQYYDRVLAIDPTNLHVLMSIGDSLYNLDREEEAIQYYDRVLAIDPTNTNAITTKKLLQEQQ